MLAEIKKKIELTKEQEAMLKKIFNEVPIWLSQEHPLYNRRLKHELGVAENMIRSSVYLPRELIELIDDLFVKTNLFPSRSDFVRRAIVEKIEKDLKLVELEGWDGVKIEMEGDFEGLEA